MEPKGHENISITLIVCTHSFLIIEIKTSNNFNEYFELHIEKTSYNS